MKDIYKKTNKNSIKYKLRSWVILSAGILQSFHYIFLLLKTKNIAFLFILLIIAFSTVMDIYDGFSIGRYDPLVIQLIGLIGSYGFMFSLLYKKKLIILVSTELLFILFGLLLRYLIYYKDYPGPRWLRQLKKSKKNRK